VLSDVSRLFLATVFELHGVKDLNKHVVNLLAKVVNCLAKDVAYQQNETVNEVNVLVEGEH
jgi:hypothetical protein